MKVSKFHLVSAATAVLGLLAAVLALVGLSGPALAVVGLAVAALAVAVVLADRRAVRNGGKPVRVPSGVGTSGGDVEARLGALDKRLEMMERRLLSSLDAARLEEAERRRAGTSG
ncbi:hypothetical protein [Myceligenerans xiligouense]|uniref:Uncharacterized protein n=1 Tax=Myceligenerans xiligouense TaxID=253184 RepID=A0A3N4YL29_9MICO|nr:hypothetical protein [Myceligenerans xiligouense]RPF20136.1 hypothetical protein EDD34_0714 [Myceligenerans xiligouense]